MKTLPLLLLLLCPVGHAADDISRHYDGVLGTSLDLSVYGVNASEAEQAFELLMRELQVLEQSLSTYRDDSELMLLNRSLQTDSASSALLDVVRLCEDWWQRSSQQFSCRLGQVLVLWQQAQQQQVIPERPDIRHAARAAQLARLDIDVDSSHISFADDISLDPSGLAKGYVIDRAFDFLHAALPAAVAIKVDIGGDARYWGSPAGQDAWQVAIADPLDTADNAGFIATLNLQSMAVAASGHNNRRIEIGRRSFSHILQARDGWPLEHGTAAIVVAKDTVSADAVATALATQPLIDGIDWVNSLPDIEALVIDSAGRQMRSAHWQQFVVDNPLGLNSNKSVLRLDFTLPAFTVSSYNRPYVAVWVSDASNKALKHLLLLGETERWARENTRWWRRVGRRNPQLLDGVARPTRGPGEYQLQWDGIDDFGQAVPAGAYVLHMEASREAGGSVYQTFHFTLGNGEHSSLVLPAEAEFGLIRLELDGNI